MNQRADAQAREHEGRPFPLDADLTAHRNSQRRFSREEWLTPMQIARKLGYTTDKPIRNAIKRGELKASHGPCRRKLIVAESDVLRWIDDDLAYEPVILDLEPPQPIPLPLNGNSRRRRQMSTLTAITSQMR